MKYFSRGLAVALLLGAAPVGIYAAYAARDGGWQKMSAESIERLQDGKLAAAKVTLKLDDAQAKLWAPVEEQIRAQYKKRAEMRAEREAKRAERKAAKDANAPRERPNIAERYEKMSVRMTERAEQMKSFSTAFSPFFASLNDEQKAVIGPVLRDLKVGPDGGGYGKGPRWASRGWGDDHRDGPHGWTKHGGPGGDGPRGDSRQGDAAPEAAPQVPVKPATP